MFQETFLSLFLKTESDSFLLFVTFIESFSYPSNTVVYQRTILDFYLFFLHIEFILSIYGFIDQLHLHERQYNIGIKTLASISILFESKLHHLLGLWLWEASQFIHVQNGFTLLTSEGWKDYKVCKMLSHWYSQFFILIKCKPYTVVSTRFYTT